ncbi:hypothetical protein CIB48_g11978 [Xylaria polymorpha]|nr:hypothetical protein CIB48_g11978 [Xylaria polymorpha]
MPAPRNEATIVYDMAAVKEWLWWRIQRTHDFDEWKNEFLKRKNVAVIQTHDGVVVWARLEDHIERHQGEFYSEEPDGTNFYMLFRQTCDFWDRGRDSARNIRTRDRPIAYAQISCMGVVWQIGRSDAYLEY